MIVLRPAERDDALALLSRASMPTKAELNVLGFATLQLAQNVMEDNIVSNKYAFAADLDGVVVAVWGSYEIRPRVWQTWMAFTDDFYAHHAEITAIVRETIDKAVVVEGAKEVRLYSALIVPKALGWLAGLGFQPTGQVEQGHGGMIHEMVRYD